MADIMTDVAATVVKQNS